MKRFFQEVGISVAENLDGVCRYRGIRYATAPSGLGRFMPPELWRGPITGVGVATANGEPHGPVLAPQGTSRLAHVMGPMAERPQSEDCLSLTVVCPRPASEAAVGTGLLPVLVWFHGGGWSSGGGDLPWYDAAALVREGPMVVVSPQVRLGALGYLVAEGVSEGNLGLLDQEAALHWVQQHIALFGGNPNAVTVMGQSAGGSAVAQLLIRRLPGWPAPDDGLGGGAPQVGALFQRAILQSPALGVLPYKPAQASQLGRRVLDALDVWPGRGTVAQWLAVQQQAGPWARELGLLAGPVHPPFGPVADGRVLPKPEAYPQALVQAAGQVDVLLGYARDELAAFEAAPAVSTGSDDVLPGLDPWFAAPAWRWAQSAVQQGRRAWVYQFDWAAPGSALGACHCIELPFVFGTFKAFEQAPMLAPRLSVPGGCPATDEQAQRSSLSRQVRQAWINFVVSGDPNQGPDSGLPLWPAVAVGRGPVMHLAAHSHCREDGSQHGPQHGPPGHQASQLS